MELAGGASAANHFGVLRSGTKDLMREERGQRTQPAVNGSASLVSRSTLVRLGKNDVLALRPLDVARLPNSFKADAMTIEKPLEARCGCPESVALLRRNKLVQYSGALSARMRSVSDLGPRS